MSAEPLVAQEPLAVSAEPLVAQEPQPLAVSAEPLLAPPGAQRRRTPAPRSLAGPASCEEAQAAVSEAQRRRPPAPQSSRTGPTGTKQRSAQAAEQEAAGGRLRGPGACGSASPSASSSSIARGVGFGFSGSVGRVSKFTFTGAGSVLQIATQQE